MVDQLNIECSRLTTEAQISELRDRVKKYAALHTKCQSFSCCEQVLML
jgi:hypothetical protein